MRAIVDAPAERVLTVTGLGREISPLADLRALFVLVREFRKTRPHIVHTHMAKAGFLGRLAARMVGVPIIVHTFHGNVLRGYFDPLRSRAFLWLERLLARLSTTIITLSPRQTEETVDLRIAPRSKLIEIPLGVDLAPLLAAQRGALRRELGLSERTALVGIVSRLVAVKAVDTFIRAAKLLATGPSDIRFVVVGDGPLRDDLERLANSMGVSECVDFLGWRSDLAAIYGDLDVVVLTSTNEGFPVSLIEALAAGRPVVAAAVGGVPDLIRDGVNGYLVPSGDPNRLAQAVSTLVASPEVRARMGAAGRDSVYPAYDSTTFIANMTRLYLELADRQGRAHADGRK
jgi:glycosyltransferase involved in cell wall biosynthesis